MIEPAISDIVGPAVSADHPYSFFDEQVFRVQYSFVERVALAAAVSALGNRDRKRSRKLLGRGAACLCVVHTREPLQAGLFKAPFLGQFLAGELLNETCQIGAALVYRQHHAEAEPALSSKRLLAQPARGPSH